MATKGLNTVQIIGRLGQAPEMRFTPQGSAVTTFSVAVNEEWTGSDGQQKQHAEWFNVVCWNGLAEAMNQYLQKGSRVYVEGKQRTRSWEDAETGQRRYKTELHAADVILLDSGARFAAATDESAEIAEVEPEPEPAAAPASPAKGRSRSTARS